MKRFLSLLLIAVLALAMLTACDRGGSDKQPDVAALAESIVKEVITEETIALSDTTLARQYTALDPAAVSEYSVYVCSSGASAQEVALFKAADSKGAAAIKTAIEARLALQVSRFENYIPAEMSKIDNAVVAEKNGYVLLAVCEDPDRAEELFLAAF